MRSFIRRTTTLAVLGALAVGSGLPAAAQSGQVDSLSQRQSILTELSPTGEAGTSRVFTQLKATGSGPVTVTLPQQSTAGLRNLDGFGKPDVNGDDVVWSLDASEDGTARSVADNTAELPVSVSVVYTLDGEEIAPRDLAGRTGKVEVQYTVRNLTAEPREIISFDAENNKFTETMDVAVPMVGSLSLTLPPSFANIDAPGAVTAGDGRGSTVVNFSLLLFAPLGDEEQVVSWTADAVDTAIPETSLQVLPVDDQSFTSLNATAEAYKGASNSLSELANGGLIINSNLKLLGAGASQLLDGLNQLADGAGQLSDGLSNTAAPGARQLSDGMSAAREGGGKLSTGLGELALGATRLSDGLNSAKDGGGKLSAGLGDLAAGAGDLAGFLGAAEIGSGSLVDGLGALVKAFGTSKDKKTAGTVLGGVAALLAGVTGDLADGAGAMQQLSAGLAGSFGPDPKAQGANAGQKAQAAATGAGKIVAGAGGIASGAAGIATGLGAVKSQNGQIPGINHVNASHLICIDPTPGQDLGGGNKLPPPGCITQPVYDALESTLGAPTLGALGVAVAPVGQSSQVLIPLSAFLDSLIANLTTNELSIQNGALAIEEGAEELREGLQAQSDSLGTVWPECPAAIAAVQSTTQVPKGLEVIKALSCISEQLNTGLHKDDPKDPGLILGMKTLQAGLDNPKCNPDRPTDPKNPCGVAQILKLLSGGSGELQDGLGQLADGGGRLAAGARTAASGSGDLVDGLRQLADGGGQLAAGAGTAASGSRDLASGLVQLDDGAGKLADGLGDAADGSTKLADGLGSAEEGGEKIAGGVGQLQEGFEERLIGGVSAGRQGASQDHEQVKAVIARGREGASPYGIADGADATTVFQFDLAGVGSEEGGPSTPLLALLAMLALAGASGLGLMLKRRLVA